MRFRGTENAVQMGGRCTHLYSNKKKKYTRMYSNLISNGTRMYRKIRNKGNQLGVILAEKMAGMWQIGDISIHSGVIWGLRVLPDKCVCDTNAYLARKSRSNLHPDGCHSYFGQEVFKDLYSRRFVKKQRGFAYD